MNNSSEHSSGTASFSSKRFLRAIAISIVALALIVFVVLWGRSSNGHFFSQQELFDAYIPAEDASSSGAIDADGSSSLDGVALSDVPLVVDFSPSHKRMNGFEVYVLEADEDSDGFAYCVRDQSGAVVQEGSVAGKNLNAESWCVILLDELYGIDETYSISMSASGQTGSVTLAAANDGVSVDELLSGDVVPEGESGLVPLLAFSYAHTVFSATEIAVFCLAILAVWFLAFTYLLSEGRRRNRLTAVGLFFVITVLLAWNYLLNPMDPGNAQFGDFQSDSEALVHHTIAAARDGADSFFSSQWNLGSYRDGVFRGYTSQFGLQGLVFSGLGVFFPTSALHIMCALLTAAVFVSIGFVLAKHYNKLLAGVFLVVFWLSPWIVDYARNLYWVEFTWFVPMLLGLVFAWRGDNRTVRILCYGGVFLAVLVKCLCGYEWIPVVLVCMVVFPFADAVAAFFKGERSKAIWLARGVVILGICGLLGFVCALVMHGYLMGESDVVRGIGTVLDVTARRRIDGWDAYGFDPSRADSFNASAWDILVRYIGLSTEILPGIPGNVLPVLGAMPLVIFAFDIARRRLDPWKVAVYATCLLGVVAWLVIMRSHAYIHTHITPVLWYMGYIQVCMYVVCDAFVRFVKGEPCRSFRPAR